MISTDYVTAMATYNAWQNGQLIALFDTMDEGELTADRGAFFGSILGTANHILWADRMWMSRLARWKRPEEAIGESPRLAPTRAAWRSERERVDGRLLHWARGLRPAQLRGDLTWYSGATKQEKTQPIALCVMHLFNHQTHHRGQIHAMLTALGHDPGVTDLPFAPTDRAA